MSKFAGKVHYIINEANEDRHGGLFATYKAACTAMRRYDEEDMERCQPAIGMVLEDGSITYDI